MIEETWIDGFNLFRHWEVTRGLFAEGDVGRAIDKSLRALARRLEGRAKRTVVYMDGGQHRGRAEAYGLRVILAGPGGKADDRMADDLAAVDDRERLRHNFDRHLADPANLRILVRMIEETWIDGFNLFRHWEATRGLFADGDVGRAIDKSLRALARRLEGRAKRTVVYIDGGTHRGRAEAYGLRVVLAGPGGKADDRMADDLAAMDDRARRVTAVSSDRELAATLRGFGATVLRVDEFLSGMERGRRASGKKSGGKNADGRREAPEKFRVLSPAEVAAWVELLGGDAEV